MSFVARCRLALPLLLVVLLTAPNAFAQPKSDEVRARELFVFGKYAEALEIYGKLYAETAHPTYLRNVARCYQNLGDADKAIANFREYLRQVKNLSADDRAVVERYIREMEALKEKQRQEKLQQAAQQEQQEKQQATVVAPRPAEPPPARTLAATDDGAKAHATAPPLVSREAEPPATGGGSSRRTASYVVGAVGLGALGVGAFYGLRAMSKQNDSDALCPMNQCMGNGLALSNDAKSAALIADIAVGAGLVGVGVAAYLFLSTPSGDAEGQRHARAGGLATLRLAPELGAHQAGLLADLSW